MKLKARLMMFTAAAALSANMANAAINAQSLADAYIAEGYSYVEVKVGPTQTKLEAVKADRKVEVIYDNATGEVIKSEFDNAGDDYVGKSGVEIEDVAKDFGRGGDDEDDDNGDDDGHSGSGGHDDDGDDSGDDDTSDGDDEDDGDDDGDGHDSGDDQGDDDGEGHDGGDDHDGDDHGDDDGDDHDSNGGGDDKEG